MASTGHYFRGERGANSRPPAPNIFSTKKYFLGGGGGATELIRGKLKIEIFSN